MNLQKEDSGFQTNPLKDQDIADAYAKMQLQAIQPPHPELTSRPASEQLTQSAADLPTPYLHPKSIEAVITKARTYIPENREFLMRQSELDGMFIMITIYALFFETAPPLIFIDNYFTNPLIINWTSLHNYNIHNIYIYTG